MASVSRQMAADEGEALDVEAIYDAHADFLYRNLHRAGVREADLPDALQDVLVVVHRKLRTYDPERARLTTWLFGICLRVAAAHRRKAHVRREALHPDPDAGAGDPEASPEAAAERRDAAERLRRVLDDLDEEKRSVFVMYELEDRDCSEIGELLGVPVGTVHSRLHAAREAFRKSLARLEAKEAHAREAARRRERGGR